MFLWSIIIAATKIKCTTLLIQVHGQVLWPWVGTEANGFGKFSDLHSDGSVGLWCLSCGRVELCGQVLWPALLSIWAMFTLLHFRTFSVNHRGCWMSQRKVYSVVWQVSKAFCVIFSLYLHQHAEKNFLKIRLFYLYLHTFVFLYHGYELSRCQENTFFRSSLAVVVWRYCRTAQRISLRAEFTNS